MKDSTVKFEDEFDLIVFAKDVWTKRTFILLVAAVFLAIGILYLLMTKKEYTAYSELLSVENSQSSSLSKLGGLAGLAGIDLSPSATGLSSTIYPEVVQSVPFKLQLLDSVLYFSEVDTSVTVRDYFAQIAQPTFGSLLKKYTLGLPKVIVGIFKSSAQPQLRYEVRDGVYFLGAEDRIAFVELSERILVEVNADNGIISITTEMPDPIAAAQLNRVTIDLLKGFVTDFRLNKARESLAFIQKSHDEAQYNFEMAQSALAEFSDRNQNVITSTARVERQRLENRYNIAFNIYSSIASQLEQAKINLNEQTPVFSVFDPIVAPNRESSPNVILILILSVFFGVFVSISWIFVISFFKVLQCLFLKSNVD